MKHVVLPDNVQRKLSFYLAMEEYVAGVTDEEAFFVWRVGRKRIVGG